MNEEWSVCPVTHAPNLTSCSHKMHVLSQTQQPSGARRNLCLTFQETDAGKASLRGEWPACWRSLITTCHCLLPLESLTAAPALIQLHQEASSNCLLLFLAGGGVVAQQELRLLGQLEVDVISHYRWFKEAVLLLIQTFYLWKSVSVKKKFYFHWIRL